MPRGITVSFLSLSRRTAVPSKQALHIKAAIPSRAHTSTPPPYPYSHPTARNPRSASRHRLPLFLLSAQRLQGVYKEKPLSHFKLRTSIPHPFAFSLIFAFLPTTSRIPDRASRLKLFLSFSGRAQLSKQHLQIKAAIPLRATTSILTPISVLSPTILEDPAVPRGTDFLCHCLCSSRAQLIEGCMIVCSVYMYVYWSVFHRLGEPTRE